MNYGELKAQVQDYLHRADLPDEVDDFIENTRQAINQRLNTNYPQLVDDADTNDLLTESSNIWLYGALEDGFAWLQNGDAARSYKEAFRSLINDLLVTNPNSSANINRIDDDTGPPQVCQWTEGTP